MKSKKSKKSGTKKRVSVARKPSDLQKLQLVLADIGVAYFVHREPNGRQMLGVMELTHVGQGQMAEVLMASFCFHQDESFDFVCE
jgi:hypothetical protein